MWQRFTKYLNSRFVIPDRESILELGFLKIFKGISTRSDIWAFNRRSVAKGLSIGIFSAYLPMPFEMIPATYLVLTYGGNLPLALLTVWSSNPFTWILFYGPPYYLGAWLMGIVPLDLTEISITMIGEHYVAMWLGCLIVGPIVASLCYVLVNFVWRLRVWNRYKARSSTKPQRK